MEFYLKGSDITGLDKKVKPINQFDRQKRPGIIFTGCRQIDYHCAKNI